MKVVIFSLSAILLFLVWQTGFAAVNDGEGGQHAVGPPMSATYLDFWYTNFTLRDELGRTWLVSESCDWLRHQANELAAWSDNYGVSIASKDVRCRRAQRDELWGYTDELFEVDITLFLPPILRKMNLAFKNLDGPNCWNAAVMTIGYSKVEENMTSAQFEQFLQEQCRPLLPDEQPVAGDVMAIRDRHELRFNPGSFGHVHGMVYSTSELIWSKNGSQARYPYELQPRERIMHQFSVYGECGSHNSDKLDCFRWVDYYSCVSFVEI